MADIKKTFGENLRRLRLRQNMSQEKLAERCGMHRTYIGGIERGERNVSIENIQKIADALGAKVAALFRGI